MTTLVDALVNVLASNMDAGSDSNEVTELRNLIQETVDKYALTGGNSSTTPVKGKRVSKSSKTTGKPTTMNPYHYFVKCSMDNIVTSVPNPKERMTEIGRMWKATQDAQRTEYSEYANRHNEYVREHLASCPNSKELEQLAFRYALSGSRFEHVAEKKHTDSASTVTTTSTSTTSTEQSAPVVQAPVQPAVQAPVQPVAQAPAPATASRTTQRVARR